MVRPKGWVALACCERADLSSGFLFAGGQAPQAGSDEARRDLAQLHETLRRFVGRRWARPRGAGGIEKTRAAEYPVHAWAMSSASVCGAYQVRRVRSLSLQGPKVMPLVVCRATCCSAQTFASLPGPSTRFLARPLVVLDVQGLDQSEAALANGRPRIRCWR